MKTTEKKSRHSWRSFEEARKFVNGLGLKSGAEWFAFAKNNACPNDIPTNPRSVYRNKGWKDMGDWLGTGGIATQNMIYRPFEEAREYVVELGLNNREDWKKWARTNTRPVDIPKVPNVIYKDTGWVSWGDWL